MELSYIFLKESFSYISGNVNSEKLFTFQDTELSYISGNRNFNKLLIFHEVTFRPQK